jgi:hypothetical protein
LCLLDLVQGISTLFQDWFQTDADGAMTVRYMVQSKTATQTATAKRKGFKIDWISADSRKRMQKVPRFQIETLVLKSDRVTNPFN